MGDRNTKKVQASGATIRKSSEFSRKLLLCKRCLLDSFIKKQTQLSTSALVQSTCKYDYTKHTQYKLNLCYGATIKPLLTQANLVCLVLFLISSRG